MKRSILWRRILREAYRFFLFFCMTAFLVSCTTSLFITALSKDLHLTLTDENLGRAAKLTFANVIVLSLLFSLINLLRRSLTTQRVTKYITDAAKCIVRGDFSVRIAPMTRIGMDEHYNEIIDCFNQMAQELQGVETLRTDFIANVSHEMKTPLAVIQNYGTLLQAQELTQEARMDYAKGVTEGARRMADMMTNILKLNRLENQKIFPQATEFDLGEQLCACLLQFEQVWEAQNIEIDTDIAEDVHILADAELLTLVWNNLLSNAFKFTPAGGAVRVSLTASDAWATVSISDTGCGMPPEVGAHIFEKFYQGDTSHAGSGNGLGLALVKRVVDILHARISVESTVGVGSTFTVKLRRC